MKLILCLDDRNGILFNNRRQSRDREAVRRIINLSKGERLFIEPYSVPLFEKESKGSFCVSENIAEEAENTGYCFLEREAGKALSDRAEGLVIYRWNRRYPGDVFFDFGEGQWEKTGEEDFAGFSHEKITEVIYRKAAKGGKGAESEGK